MCAYGCDVQEAMADEELCTKAGADVLVHTPEIRNWLLSVLPGEAMVVGSYVYLDGCRLSLPNHLPQRRFQSTLMQSGGVASHTLMLERVYERKP